MSTLQVRNVREETTRALKARASLAGMSLSDYVRGELEDLVERPSREALLSRIAEDPVRDLTPAEDILAMQRGAR